MEMREGSETRRARFESLAPGLIEPLRRYLRRRTDAATADDVLADTLLVCWRRLDELDDEPLPWAYGVARRCLANAERAERKHKNGHAPKYFCTNDGIREELAAAGLTCLRIAHGCLIQSTLGNHVRSTRTKSMSR